MSDAITQGYEMSRQGLRLYVASSWRNEQQPDVVKALREAGHEVYDFRHPAPGVEGFSWSSIDEHWLKWTPEQFRDALQHPIAQAGFAHDMKALRDCEACVLVLPCGRSAHLEAGWAAGAGKAVFVLATTLPEPELMYLMNGVQGGIVLDVAELRLRLAQVQNFREQL